MLPEGLSYDEVCFGIAPDGVKWAYKVIAEHSRLFGGTPCLSCHNAYAYYRDILVFYQKKVKMSKYKLKKGRLIQLDFGGLYYSNNNLTDGIAEKYLKKYPKTDVFEITLDVEVKTPKTKKTIKDASVQIVQGKN